MEVLATIFVLFVSACIFFVSVFALYELFRDG